MANRFLSAIKARFFRTAADTAVDIGVDGDNNPRLAIDAGGRISWGDGSSPVDTNIYRSGANKLKTDDAFRAPVFELDHTHMTTSFVALTGDQPGQVIDVAIGKSIKYLIHAENSTNHEITEILAVKKDSLVNYVEYGKISTSGVDLVVYDVVLDSENFHLTVNPVDEDMSFTVFKTIIS
jgi:hypothetical protein